MLRFPAKSNADQSGGAKIRTPSNLSLAAASKLLQRVEQTTFVALAELPEPLARMHLDGFRGLRKGSAVENQHRDDDGLRPRAKQATSLHIMSSDFKSVTAKAL